jgi:hypothetical protein
LVTADELSARGDYYTDFILAQVVFMREGGNLHFVTQTTSGTHDVFSDVRVMLQKVPKGFICMEPR